jgi:hypothetical protein
MNHFTQPSFWKDYGELPPKVRDLADKNFALLKGNPQHPSLHLKKVGKYWSARVGIHHRALAVEASDGLVWIAIVRHKRYDQML